MRLLTYLIVLLLVVSSIDAGRKGKSCSSSASHSGEKCNKKLESQECSKNEEFSECGNHPCQNTCEEPNRIASCSHIPGCYPGCICKQGFLRNAKGVCTAARSCYKCAKDEIFTECGANECQNTCANPTLSQLCEAIPGCFPGCICKKGFLRNQENGKCVRKIECPKCEGENQVYSACDNHPCQNTCENPNLILACTFEAGCYPGCICADGFLKNANGQCVASESCSPKTCSGANEEYQTCGTACPRTCDNKDDETLVCTANCVEGCFCKEGFVRDGNGVCVPPAECGCKENEQLNPCSNPCPPRTCSAIGKMFKCPAPDPNACVPACECAYNYRRNANGVCIPIQDCPPLACNNGPNEVYDSCPDRCAPRTCEDLYNPPECQSKILIECKPRCVCQEGYLRNLGGVCVPKDQCRKPCNANEVYNVCPFTCPPEATCESHLSGMVYACAAPPDDFKCVPRCECDVGFVRKTPGGECIKAESCCDDPNAEVVDCPNPCPGGTCEVPEFGQCLAPCKLRGCQCKKGYVKDTSGKCILLSKCPKTPKCKKNEVYKNCGTACPATCAVRSRPCTKQCVPGCFCKDGFILDKDKGKCIPIDNCPKTCQANEVLNPCPYSCPPEETCDSYVSGLIVVCAPPPEDRECVPRCECQTGLVRKTPGGVCIDPKTCCDDPNAEVVSCPNPCPGGTCKSPEFADCKAPCKLRGCQCKKGYVKDADGKCILLSKCPDAPECGRNQVFKRCGTACPATCAVRSRPCTKQCVTGCFCKDGFILDKDKGKCIPIDQCPQNCTGVHEVWSECGNNSCQRNCDTYGRDDIACRPICTPGCICEDGYIRNGQGVCVTPEECPNKTCKKNEVYKDCGTACPETCANRNPVCTDQCVPGCFCKDGFLLDKKNGSCIAVDKCPKPKCTGKNEEYTDCGTACPLTCDNKDDNIFCTLQCVPGCFCKAGFVRDKNGVCIDPKLCPNKNTCGPNETFSKLAPEIQETCATLGKKPKPCKKAPGCVCAKGFVRKVAKGKCVKKETCKK